MDPVRLGRQVRALRRRRRWRQADLARSARVSRTMVWRIEAGRADELTLRQVDGVIRALSARLELQLSWHGEGLDRLLDADHAALVEAAAAELRALGWQVAVEVSFNIRGERGSIDLLAYHPPSQTVVVIEVKSVVPDLQATLVVLDRKTRLAPEIARGRGWTVRGVGRVLVLADGRTTRRRVAEHQAVFAAALPHRTVATKHWLRAPEPGKAFAGIWFLAIARRVSARQRIARHVAAAPHDRAGHPPTKSAPALLVEQVPKSS